ncbi:MAG: ATP-binding protein [Flavobacteriales bacterium]|nr:ATP-binding protein [Flavobacteriales bacterium]
MISREVLRSIEQRLSDKKAIILLGPRQVGKTTLLKHLEKTSNLKSLWWNGDDTDVRQMLQEPTSTKLNGLIGNAEILIIDEAQRISDIGLCIKIIVDTMPNVKVIATGSSAFELANKINEPLTGRKWQYYLYPISFSEMVSHTSLLEEKRMLEHRLIYGYYPDVLNNPGDEAEIVNQLSDSYLYQDILTWGNIKRPEKLEHLVQALAFQLGNEVSYNELAKTVGLDNETVEKYIQLLEKAFIVFRLSALSRNLRNELKKSRKIYFYDNGIRNAVIKQFNPLALRNDVGALWENFMISERKKHLEYNRIASNQFFWRTHTQQEIDYIEERNGTFYAYEFKWGTRRQNKFPKSFLAAYPNNETMFVTKENYTEFVL